MALVAAGTESPAAAAACASCICCCCRSCTPTTAAAADATIAKSAPALAASSHIFGSVHRGWSTEPAAEVEAEVEAAAAAARPTLLAVQTPRFRP